MRTVLKSPYVQAVALAVAVSGCALSPPPTAGDLQRDALPHTSGP